MRSDGNNFNYFPKNKLTKLANFVQFMRMFTFCLEDWRAGPPALPLGYDTGTLSRKLQLLLNHEVAVLLETTIIH